MRPLRGPSRVEVGQGHPDAAHGRRAERTGPTQPRGPTQAPEAPEPPLRTRRDAGSQRCEAQPNRTATSCQSQGLREDRAEGRGGLTEFVHTPWSTGKTKLTSSGRSEQRGSNTEARKISCHIRKTQQCGRREEHMFRNAHKRPHQSPDVCSQTEKTTDARGSRHGGTGPAGRNKRKEDDQSGVLTEFRAASDTSRETARHRRARGRGPRGNRVRGEGSQGAPSPSKKLPKSHMAEHSSCLGRWGRVKTEAPRAWPPPLLPGTSRCPGGPSEPTPPHL